MQFENLENTIDSEIISTLHVPLTGEYKEKDMKLGARWDQHLKQFCVHPGKPLVPFMKWVPVSLARDLVGLQKSTITGSQQERIEASRTAAQRRTSRGPLTRSAAKASSPQPEAPAGREDTRELGPLTGQPNRKVHSIGPFKTSRPERSIPQVHGDLPVPAPRLSLAGSLRWARSPASTCVQLRARVRVCA